MQTQVIRSTRPGMGANPYLGGVTFRVWAPHASRVLVSGSFNGWSKSEHPLAEEGKGLWSADIAAAKVGDEYRYLLYNGEQELSRIDPYARQVTNSVGNAIIIDPAFDWGDDHFQMPAWNEMVLYEIHIGTFNRQPAQNDRPGTFHSATEKLPYLRDLGINAIEVMPVAEFPGGFSWGYNPAHPFAVESDYGGARAFKELVKAAHAQGIAVILDVVYNHFGPTDLALWQFDGWSQDGKGGIYFYNDQRAATPWGDTRPDYGRGEVRQYIRDNALMWLEEYRVDGLRWDATAYIRDVAGNEDDPATGLPDGWSLMQWVHEEIRARQPWKVTLAEDFRDNAAITRDVTSGGAGFGAQWDGAFTFPIRQAIIAPDDAARDLNAVRDAICHSFDNDAFRRVVYTESHDEVANGKARVPEEIWPGQVGSWFAKKRSTLGAALALTSPGIPMLFQGQEFLEDRWFSDRDPVEWARAEQFGGMVALYRELIRLRRNLDGVTGGLCGQFVEMHHLDHEHHIIAFHRHDKGGPRDSAIVVVNMANNECDDYPIGFPREGTWRVRFNSDSSFYDSNFWNHASPDVEAKPAERDGMPCEGLVNIGPYTVLVLSQDE
jgi:1,4-alpha-glucan branching enzyme